MEKNLYLLLFGILIILLTACTGTRGQASPTAAGTTMPGDQTITPFVLQTDTTGIAITATPPLAGTAGVDLTATIATSTGLAGTASTDTIQTGSVPVTGADLTLLEGQFCIEGMAHALLVLPDTATFQTLGETATTVTPETGMGCNTVDRYSGRQIVICRGQQNTSLNLNICTDGNNCTPLLVELQACPVGGTVQPGIGATNTPEAGLPSSTLAVSVTETPPALIITVVTP